MLKLDRTDLQILMALEKEGRITKASLAEQVNLSATPVWERLKRLEKAGLIEGYGARFNLSKLGPHVEVFVAAELLDHTAASFRHFEKAVQRYEEIVACWALGGGFDYLLDIITRDIDSYQRLLDAMLDAEIGLNRYFSYIVTKPVKQRSGMPLALLAGLDDQS